MHDQAAVRQTGKADDRGLGRLHAAFSKDPHPMAMQFPTKPVQWEKREYRGNSARIIGINLQKTNRPPGCEKTCKKVQKVD
jgi:hypothetical protein